MVKEKELSELQASTLIDPSHELILYNDDVNEFTFVTESLIDVCKIESIQAEQITLIAHLKGKCGVISGSISELKPKYEQLISLGLTVSID